jgi:hypothetical protein
MSGEFRITNLFLQSERDSTGHSTLEFWYVHNYSCATTDEIFDRINGYWASEANFGKTNSVVLWLYSSHLVFLNYFHVTEQNKISWKLHNFETHFGCGNEDIIDIKTSIFWDITNCSLLKFNQCFRGTCCFLHLLLLYFSSWFLF